MQIFLSYASEDRELADQVHMALVGSGHKVFFDRESLPPGGDYHARIRSAVERSDLFVFLISPNSVAPGSYALTELKYARARWPHPKDRVLPVRVRAVSWEIIPSYLKAVTVLEPEGNIPAEVLAAVAQMTPQAGFDERTASEMRVKSDTAHERTRKITVPVLVAIIGMAGALGASVIANWDKLFRSPLPPEVRPGLQSTDKQQQPPVAKLQPQEQFTKLPQEKVELRMMGVTLFPHDPDAEVQVLAFVNSTPFTYPSLAGVSWLRVGPAMSHQRFSLPKAARYDLRFEMKTKSLKGIKQLVSQDEVVVTKIPHDGEYNLHLKEQETRAAAVSATVRFVVEAAQ